MFKFSPNIAVNVSDAKKASDFYKNVLGFEKVPSTTDEHGIEMKKGPITFWIDQAGPLGGNGFVFFEFIVEDLAKAKNLLQENGCEMLTKTSGPNFEGQMVADPYGFRFHLYQSKTRSL